MQDYRGFNASVLAERCLLSAIMQRTIAPSECGISPADFGAEELKTAFLAALEMERAGQDIDMVSLAMATGNDDLIDIAQEEGYSFILAQKHAQIVHEYAQRRAVRSVMLEAERMLGAPDASVSSVCLTMRDKLREVIEGSTAATTRNMLELVTEAAAAFKNPQTLPPCVTTGIPKLDAVLGGAGMKPSNLVVIGARPGVGKSALMLAMAIAAGRDGKKVLYISLEMSDEENAQRALVHTSGIALPRFLLNELSTEDDEWVGKCSEAFRLSNIEHYAASICRVSDIRNMAAQMKDRKGLDMICVDYIGLLRPEMPLGNRVNEISQITRDLKALAMEMNIVVIAASQLNRDNTKANRRPQLSDLRESGSIEQDANIVVFVHEKTDQPDEPGRKFVELIIAKNRQGQQGYIDALFDGATMTFTEVM